GREAKKLPMLPGRAAKNSRMAFQAVWIPSQIVSQCWISRPMSVKLRKASTIIWGTPLMKLTMAVHVLDAVVLIDSHTPANQAGKPLNQSMTEDAASLILPHMLMKKFRKP